MGAFVFVLSVEDALCAFIRVSPPCRIPCGVVADDGTAIFSMDLFGRAHRFLAGICYGQDLRSPSKGRSRRKPYAGVREHLRGIYDSLRFLLESKRDREI